MMGVRVRRLWLTATERFAVSPDLPLAVEHVDAGQFLGSFSDGNRTTPPLVELQHALDASRAVEAGTETAADLRYLQGKGTSLGGMRPKCTVVDADGTLALGKFPSLQDQRQEDRAYTGQGSAIQDQLEGA